MNNQDDQINQELKSLCEQLAKPMPARCDDAKIMHIWRECGLPEYFLGNGGTNTKLVEFAARVSESRVRELEQALSTIRDIAAKSRITELEQERERLFDQAKNAEAHEILAQAQLQAVIQERDREGSYFKLEDEFLKLQAHNKAMREALEMLLGNERCPAWADKIIRSALRTEVPKP